MIDAKELRIGNWVINKHNEYARVYELVDKGMRIHHKPTVQYDCNPIPLTEDTLVKIGFEKIDDCEYSFTVDDDYCFKYCKWSTGEWELFLGNDDTDIPLWLDHIKSIHQLQNLTFALTGTELDFKNDQTEK